MSNFRIVKGTAVYTGDFTVPTGPLTAITNTKLLCLCSNHFKDKSTSAHTLSTGTGSPFSTGFLPKVRAFSPFARSAAYDPAVHGGSMWVTHDSHVHVSDATDFDFPLLSAHALTFDILARTLWIGASAASISSSNVSSKDDEYSHIQGSQ